MERVVLILVVMEYALEYAKSTNSPKGMGLNPCFNGSINLSVEVLLKSLHLLRNRTPRQGATIAMKQLRFLLRKIPCCNGICSMSKNKKRNENYCKVLILVIMEYAL